MQGYRGRHLGTCMLLAFSKGLTHFGLSSLISSTSTWKTCAEWTAFIDPQAVAECSTLVRSVVQKNFEIRVCPARHLVAWIPWQHPKCLTVFLLASMSQTTFSVWSVHHALWSTINQDIFVSKHIRNFSILMFHKQENFVNRFQFRHQGTSYHSWLQHAWVIKHVSGVLIGTAMQCLQGWYPAPKPVFLVSF